MKVTAIKTEKVIPNTKNIFEVLDTHLLKMPEHSILAVTSKIVAICEGRVVFMETADKDELIRQEASYYLPREQNKYDVSHTITRNNLVAAAGIDESNGNGYYILWPKDIQKSVNSIREYLKKRFNLHQVGVIITDSRTTPMRWGVTVLAIGHSGFAAVNNFIGKPDIFGRLIEHTMVNVADGLAAAAGVAMGESNEQTPLAVIEDVPFVQFQDRNPSEKELKRLIISPEDDLYAPLLTSVKWKKGNA